jgi:hypothetical protein
MVVAEQLYFTFNILKDSVLVTLRPGHCLPELHISHAEGLITELTMSSCYSNRQNDKRSETRTAFMLYAELEDDDQTESHCPHSTELHTKH